MTVASLTSFRVILGPVLVVTVVPFTILIVTAPPLELVTSEIVQLSKVYVPAILKSKAPLTVTFVKVVPAPL